MAHDQRLDNNRQSSKAAPNSREQQESVGAEDERLDRSDRRGDPIRETRGMIDRAITENRELTDEERLTAFRMGLYQEILPDIPAIKGYHVCWHTTNNPKDSVERRQMLGFELIKPEDVPGMLKAPTFKQGEFQGYVGMREMVAMKIKLDLYYKYIRHSHHDAPNALVSEIMERISEHGDELSGRGSRLMVGRGIREMEDATRRKPKFSDDPGDRL